MTTDVDDTVITTGAGHDEDEEDATTHVGVFVHLVGGLNLNASAALEGQATDDQVARLILRAALGAAQLHGTGAWIALQQLTTTEAGST